MTVNIFIFSPYFGFINYYFIEARFAEVTTLFRELIFSRIAENNRVGIFSKHLLDVGCDNLPESPKKKHFSKSMGYVLLFLHSRFGANICAAYTPLRRGAPVTRSVARNSPRFYASEYLRPLAWLNNVGLPVLYGVR